MNGSESPLLQTVAICCDAVDEAIRQLRASGKFAQLQANRPGTEASL